MISAELKPCPFCNDAITYIWSPAQGGYSVICGNGCGAEGPVMENEKRAAEAWNGRAMSQEDREALEWAATEADGFARECDSLHCGAECKHERRARLLRRLGAQTT